MQIRSLALRTWPHKTQREIAEQVGCGLGTVNNVKRELFTREQLTPPATVTGKDGRPTRQPKAERTWKQQAKDDSLRKMADRIQSRAINRCGELLRQIPEARGANQNIEEGALPNVVTRTSAAEDAGLSEHQREIAAQVGCAFQYVSTVKSQLSTSGQLNPPATVTGKDGKTYPTTKGRKDVLALDILPHLEAQAKERQLATLKQGNAVQALLPERDELADQAFDEWFRFKDANNVGNFRTFRTASVVQPASAPNSPCVVT